MRRRFRYPGQSQLPYGREPRGIVGGVVKLVAVVAVAGLGGLGLGTGLGKLSGDKAEPVGALTSSSGSSTSSTSSAVAGPELTTAPTPALATTDTASTATTTTAVSSAKPRKKRVSSVRVRVVSAILHPASSASGRRRQRARLSIHVRVTNRTTRRVVLTVPVLVSGSARVKAGPNAGGGTTLGPLAPGSTKDQTLRFEVAGSVTTTLRGRGRGHLIIAGRRVTAAVKVGRPVAARRVAARRRASSGGARQTPRRTAPPPPPPVVRARPPVVAPPPPPPLPKFDSSG